MRVGTGHLCNAVAEGSLAVSTHASPSACDQLVHCDQLIRQMATCHHPQARKKTTVQRRTHTHTTWEVAVLEGEELQHCCLFGNFAIRLFLLLQADSNSLHSVHELRGEVVQEICGHILRPWVNLGWLALEAKVLHQERAGPFKALQCQALRR